MSGPSILLRKVLEARLIGQVGLRGALAGRSRRPRYRRHHHGSLLVSLRTHWHVYAMEAVELGAFMIVAGCASVAFSATSSPLRIPNGLLNRGATGAAMGLTAIMIIYSPLGRRSGAHFNPAVTLTFFRLHLVKTCDAVFYVLAQVTGAAAGVAVVSLALGSDFGARPVRYVATLPGTAGVAGALVAEIVISFLLMSTVLAMSNHDRLKGCTGFAAGTLVFLFICFEAPLSGMSMNPARTFGSDVLAAQWTTLWIYVIAPLVGMLSAAQLHVRLFGWHLRSAKLHDDHRFCIFLCDDHDARPRE